MNIPTQKAIMLIALTLPFLVLGYLSLMNHKAQNSGTEWRVEISGYDPRDLLHGRYLRYQIDWTKHGISTNGSKTMVDSLCLTRDTENTLVPSIKMIDSTKYGHAKIKCESIIAAGQNADNWNLRMRQYYIPESFANTLDRAFRNNGHKYEISIRVSDDHRLSVGDLYIDGTIMSEAMPSLEAKYGKDAVDISRDWRFHITSLKPYYESDIRSCYSYAIDWAAHNYTPAQSGETETLCLNEIKTDMESTTLITKWEDSPAQSCEAKLHPGSSGRNDWNYPIRTFCKSTVGGEFLNEVIKNTENTYSIVNTINRPNSMNSKLSYSDTLYINEQTYDDAYKAYRAIENNKQ
jgi:uncharacterized membrane-anchored protein